MNEPEHPKSSLQATLDEMTRQLEKEINNLEQVVTRGANADSDGQNNLEEDLNRLVGNIQVAYSEVQDRLSLLAIFMKQKQELDAERSSINEEQSGSRDKSAVAQELEKQYHHQENASGERGSQWLSMYKKVARSKQLKNPQQPNSNSSTAVNRTKDEGSQEDHTKSLSSDSQEAANTQTTAQLSAEREEICVTAVTNEVVEGTQISHWAERKLKNQEREKAQKGMSASASEEARPASQNGGHPNRLQTGWPERTGKHPQEDRPPPLPKIFKDFDHSLRACIRWRQSPLQSKPWQLATCLLLGLFLGVAATIFLFYDVPETVIMGVPRSWVSSFPRLVLGMFVLFVGFSALSKRIRSIFFSILTLTWGVLIGWYLVTQFLITSSEFHFLATQLSKSMALIKWTIAVGCIVFAAQFVIFKKPRPVILTYSYGFLLAAFIALGLVYVSPTRFI